MDKLPNDVIDIVEKYRRYELLPHKEKDYLTEQINKAYH